MLSTDRTQQSLSRAWFGISVGSLLLAGILAALLVIARMPPFHQWITDPLFFKRCLVVHVDLSLFVWFCSFLMFLFSRLPRDPRFLAQEIAALSCAILGILLMVIAAGAPGSVPILANYLPVIDHPLFSGGLVFFAVGMGLQILQPRLIPERDEAPSAYSRIGIRAASIALLFAMITIWAAWWSTSRDLGPSTYYELLVWGGGHVFQFANTCGMLVAWTALTLFATGRAPCSQRTAFVLFTWLLIPVFAAPILAMNGTDNGLYRSAFTAMMQWGIFPPVCVYLVLCVRQFIKHRHETHDRLAVSGFAVSAFLTITGYVLGALIRGSNTLIPAHYHANIGAVTVAYMAVAFYLLPDLGYRIESLRLRAWSRIQPALFGIGQSIFAIGFGLAGAYGMGRKLYGQEQAIRHTGEWIGLVVMGLGGLVAIAGGIAFLWIAIHAMSHPNRQVHHTLPVTNEHPA